jgi:hypothetical protein
MSSIQKIYVTAAMIAALLSNPISSAFAGGEDKEVLSDKKKKADNIETVIIPDFDKRYDVNVKIWTSREDAARWYSAGYHDLNRDTDRRSTSDSEKCRIVDGRAIIDFSVPIIGTRIFFMDIEFRTYFDKNRKPLENIIATRDKDKKNTLSGYSLDIAQKEFEDWKDIRTIYQTIFDYKKGVAGIHSKKDTVVAIDNDVLDIFGAYFAVTKFACGNKVSRGHSADTSFSVLYETKIRSIEINASIDSLELDDQYRILRKVACDFTELDADGKRKPFIDGIEKIILYLEKENGPPVWIDSKTTSIVNPYATDVLLRGKY